MATRSSIRRRKPTGATSTPSVRAGCDEAKRFAEAMTMAYHRYHGVDTKIVRIFNTYGPHARQRRPRGSGVHVAGAPQ